MNTLKKLALAILALIVLALGSTSIAQAQVKVTAADPASASQGTISLDVTISGSGFDNTAKVRFLVAGTTDTGGVTVKKVTVKSSKRLIATIDVADTAVIKKFDIEVSLGDGRKGIGTTVFAVTSDPCAVSGLDFPAFIYWVINGSTSRDMYVADSTGTCSRLVIKLTSASPGGASFSYPVGGTADVGRAIWPAGAGVYAIDFTVTGTSITLSSPRTISTVAGSAYELSKDGNTLYYGVGPGSPTGSPRIHALNISTGDVSVLWVGSADGSAVNGIAVNGDDSALFVDLVGMSGPDILLRIDLPCVGPCSTVLYTNAAGTQGPIFPSASLVADPILGYPLLVYSDFLAGFNQCFQLRFSDFSGNLRFTGTQPRYGKLSSWYGGKVLTDGHTAPSRSGTCAETGMVTQIDPSTGAETPLVHGYFPDGR